MLNVILKTWFTHRKRSLVVNMLSFFLNQQNLLHLFVYFQYQIFKFSKKAFNELWILQPFITSCKTYIYINTRVIRSDTGTCCD